MMCELEGFALENGWGACEGRPTFEHVISKSKFQGNKEGLRLAEEVYPYIFGAETCLKHNSGNKCADTEEAVVYLLLKRWQEYPEEFPKILKEVADTFKATPPKYFSLEWLAQFL